jgi:hypothetical protein
MAWRGSGPPSPSRYRVDRWCTGEITSLMLPETADFIWHAQMAPECRWLIVKSRTRSEQDRNARIYGNDGELQSTFHVGDGIEDVQTTESGDVWVSYFDEGVFGDLPLGSSGLVCFSLDGEVLFQFSGESRPVELRSVADCYALNVATSEDVWFCFYESFPLVHLRSKAIAGHWCDNPVKGSHAFAVAGERALFAGGYKEKGRTFLLHLDGMALEEVAVVDDGGHQLLPVPKHHACFGRAERYYVHTDTGLFVVCLDDID